MKDNQGRDLAGVKRHFDREAQRHEEGVRRSHERFVEQTKRTPLADWTTFEGVLVLRSGKSNFVAVPRNGKKTSAVFEVISIAPRELVTVLKKDEVRSWLWRKASAEDDQSL